LLTRLENAAVACVAYLGQTFYPVDMAIVYPNLGTRLPVMWVVGSVVLLVTITLVAIVTWRTRPYLIVGWLWFLGMLVPVLGLVGQFTHSRADRYTYLTQIGLTIALAWTVWGVFQSRQAIAPTRWREQALALVAGGAVLVLGAVAFRQDSFWRNAETLWTHAIACTEQNAMAHYCLAVNYVNDDKIDQAIPQLEEALAAGSIKRSLIGKAHVLLGECFALQGRFDEAIAQYEEMVRLFPAVEMGHVSLAMTLASAGRHERAITQWNEAIRLNPTFWAARIGLAESLLAAGDAAEAARQCRQVLEQQPGAIKAMVLLGAALVAQGQTDEAIRQFEQVVELNSQNVTAQYRLGLLEYEAGQAESALSHLSQAIKLEPGNAPLLRQTAWILATCPEEQIRDGDRAVELAQKAIKLASSEDPRDFDVLAAAYAEKGDFAAAVKAARQASTLALTQDKLELTAEITARMRLYRDGQPFREPAAKPRPTSAAPAKQKSATGETQPES
jgi:tetratricopeptide (TPR) repeat protein